MIKDVVDYMDYREFLSDYYSRQKASKPYFSHRYFCRRAGFKTSNVLKLVIDRRRNLSRTAIIRFSKAMELTVQESAYFEALVLYNQAKEDRGKAVLLSRVLDLKRAADVRLIEERQYGMYAEWYHTVVREMVELPGFDGTSAWIAKRIYPRVGEAKISASLQLLHKIGLLYKDSRGKYRVKDAAIATLPEVDSAQVAHVNREMIRLAIEASFGFGRKQREISGLTLRMSRQCYQAVKQRIVEFKEELLAMAISDKDSDRIYQINVQLFPLLWEERKP
jgi:uncharacterized protein (TIGR02147 family)